MLGGDGLAHSSKLALLNANYIAHRLKDHYTLRYTNVKGRVAHELLIDLAEFDKSAGLKVSDFAKRLQVCMTPSNIISSNSSLATQRTTASTLRHVRGLSRRPC